MISAYRSNFVGNLFLIFFLIYFLATCGLMYSFYAILREKYDAIAVKSLVGRYCKVFNLGFFCVRRKNEIKFRNKLVELTAIGLGIWWILFFWLRFLVEFNF
jgi:hypothetical protein